VILKLLVGIAALTLGAVGYVSTQHSPSALPTLVAAQPPAPNAANGEQRLELTEQTLTERLNQRLVGQPPVNTPLGPAILTHVTAQLKNGQLVTTGDAQVGSTSVPVSVTSHMLVQSSRTVVLVEDARAAGMPLPDSARQSVQQAIQNQLDQEVDRMQVRVTSVTIADGKLVIIGTPSS
jgi:hypothetical protein